jgi:FtsP/CotA-like multicopper oxidase with cupredoxin domain
MTSAKSVPPPFRITATQKLFLIFIVFMACRVLGESLSPIVVNNNRNPAGVLQNGVLSIKLEIAKGEWHPEADGEIAVAVYAFGEYGHPLQNPGPLIRVPQGTEIDAFLHNNLSVPIAVNGLGVPGTDSVVHITPGAAAEVQFRATRPGLYFYWGSSEANDLKLRHGIDSELTGAIVVDPPGPARTMKSS